MASGETTILPAQGATVWWRAPAFVIGVVALLASGAAFGWALNGYFVGDDFGYVARFAAYPFSEWPRLFHESWAGTIWASNVRELRPFAALSFMLDARLAGDRAWMFRTSNLLMHAGCVFLVGMLAWRAAERRLVPGIAAAVLFALHPAHAEPVQWITGRVDVLTTLLYLAGFVAFLRYREKRSGAWLAVFTGFYVMAAFAKEFGLTLPLMCLLADLIWRPQALGWLAPRRWAPYVLSGIVAVIYSRCRRAAFGSGSAGADLPELGSAAFREQLSQRQLTYLGHLFPPAHRWFNPSLSGPFALQIMTVVLVVVGVFLAIWCWRARATPITTRRSVLFFGVAWYLIVTVPLIVTYVSARHLYLASAGTCIALVIVLHSLLKQRVVFFAVLIALSALFTQRLSETIRPWRDASLVSLRLIESLRQLEPELVPGGALLLDMPEVRDGAYVWAWGVPFLMRPPFLRERWDDRVVVLESRGLYFNPDLWTTQPAMAAFGSVTKPSWILFGYDEKVRRIPVPVARIPAAAEHFRAAPLADQPHESWRKLINELATP